MCLGGTELCRAVFRCLNTLSPAPRTHISCKTVTKSPPKKPCPIPCRRAGCWGAPARASHPPGLRKQRLQQTQDLLWVALGFFFFFLFGFWSADGQPLTSGLRFYFLPGKRGCEINEEPGRKLGSGWCWLGAAPPLCPQPGEFLAPRGSAPRGCCSGFWGAFALRFWGEFALFFGVHLLQDLGCICSKPITFCFHQTQWQTAPPQGCFLSQTFFPFP